MQRADCFALRSTPLPQRAFWRRTLETVHWPPLGEVEAIEQAPQLLELLILAHLASAWGGVDRRGAPGTLGGDLVALEEAFALGRGRFRWLLQGLDLLRDGP